MLSCLQISILLSLALSIRNLFCHHECLSMTYEQDLSCHQISMFSSEQCVLQCVEMCCSVLQCVAVCCSVLQCLVIRYLCFHHECDLCIVCVFIISVIYVLFAISMFSSDIYVLSLQGGEDS